MDVLKHAVEIPYASPEVCTFVEKLLTKFSTNCSPEQVELWEKHYRNIGNCKWYQDAPIETPEGSDDESY